jgi:ubiquinone/menaquinone biosynthesis C-methylase UbiE
MALDKTSTARLYRKRAPRYDLTANLYYLVGFREWDYRRKAVQALNLNRGDTVVEIGCGTGLNFGLLQERVGPDGVIIGVDLTPEMLAKAAQRVECHRWTNVRLVECDAAEYEFPQEIDGVVSTLAITLVPEYDRVIRDAAAALSPGKRLVILDFKKPEHWPDWLIRLFVAITRPFGVSLDLAQRHPWESVDRYMKMIQFHELYFGALYLCVGEAPVGGLAS